MRTKFFGNISITITVISWSCFLSVFYFLKLEEKKKRPTKWHSLSPSLLPSLTTKTAPSFIHFGFFVYIIFFFFWEGGKLCYFNLNN